VQDIFQQTPSARRILSRLLHDSLKQQATPPLAGPELVGLLEMPLDRIQNVSLEVNTVTMYLSLHDTANPRDTIAISINKSLLKDALTDRYRAEDPDTIAVKSTRSDYQIITPPLAGDTINPAGKLIALTFDDGPGDMTPQLLDALDMYESHATFFVLGHLVSTYQATLQRAIHEGNEIGNHSWNHRDLRTQSQAGLDQQVMGTEQAIQAATGYTPTRMRPPYGGTNPAVHQYLANHNLTQTLWNVDTNDWRDRDAQLIYDRIMGAAVDGRVLLLHDIHPTSVEAALRAIRELKAQGFQLVTVSQLYQYR
jgi:peptidoglycan/xylan/chitin deacetylase (PgdA/CDA1 family)